MKKAPAPAPKPVASKPAAKPFSFGTLAVRKEGTSRPPKKAAADTKNAGVPVLKNFVQNADGSLTGNVSGSKNFRQGEKITTSPVRRGAKAGMLVKTGSGSTYKLE